MAYSWIVTLRNGREISFDSAKVDFEVKGGKVTSCKAMTKDKGVSLMFVDPDEIAAIVRDARRMDED